MADADDLPPTQSLALEVLTARYRLGETLWTFSTRHRPALQALERRGLVWLMHGVVERTCRASLTEAGRKAALSDGYVPPVGTVTEWGVRHPASRQRDCVDMLGEQAARAVLPTFRRTYGDRAALVSRQVGPWTEAAGTEPREDENP